MAKKKNTAKKVAELTKKVADAEKAQADLLKAVGNESLALDATFTAATNSMSVGSDKKAGKVAKLFQNLENKQTRTHKVAVDFGGGTIAQVSTELLNWGIRATGRWTPKSWFGEHADLLQAAPHVILGLGVYIAEMASRKNLVMPSTTREVVSEASKLFGQLGFSNLVRALRVRYTDSKHDALDYDALKRENEQLHQRNQELLLKSKEPE